MSYKPLTVNERLKYEVAQELGFMDKLLERGWPGLTARESGRVGGIVRARLKDMNVQ